MILERRKFLIGMGAGLTTMAAIDPLRKLHQRIRGGNIVLADQELVIYRPLVLTELDDCILTGLIVRAGNGFQGGSLLELNDCNRLQIRDSYFDMNNLPKKSVGIQVNSTEGLFHSCRFKDNRHYPRKASS